MSLTAQFFAGDTDKLWTNVHGGGLGTHTGTPSNGSHLGAWQDEATPSTRNVSWQQLNSQTASRPTFATPGAMLLPSVLFDGSEDGFNLSPNNGMGDLAASDFLSVSAKTIVGSFRMTAAATDNATIYRNSTIVADKGGYFGVFAKTSGGVHSLYAYNWDGNSDVTSGLTFSLNTDYVFLLRHNGSTLYLSLLSGAGGATRADASVASGSTTTLNDGMRLGRSGWTEYFTGAIGELYFDNTDLGSTNTPLTDIVGRWLPAASPSINASQRMISVAT